MLVGQPINSCARVSGSRLTLLMLYPGGYLSLSQALKGEAKGQLMSSKNKDAILKGTENNILRLHQI